MQKTSLRMRRKSWKGFHKMASSTVSNTIMVGGRSSRLQNGTILKQISLKYLYSFVFRRNAVIPWIFWSHDVHAMSMKRFRHGNIGHEK
jgi:hypothetical protein